jgi:hypothetical protein
MMLKALLFILLPPVLSVSTGPGCFKDQRTDKQQNTITDSIMINENNAIIKIPLSSVFQVPDKFTDMANHIRALQATLNLRGLNL